MLRLKARDGEVSVSQHACVPDGNLVVSPPFPNYLPPQRAALVSMSDIAKLRDSPLIQELMIDE